MTFVPHDTLEIYIGGFVGTPQSLILDVINQDGVLTSYTLGSSPEISGSASTEYTFLIVPTDSDGGVWKYRWRGRLADGKSFARPSEQRWNNFVID